MENNVIPPQQESIKLIKNAKGTYQWEIKLLDSLDTELKKRYGKDGRDKGSRDNPKTS